MFLSKRQGACSSKLDTGIVGNASFRVETLSPNVFAPTERHLGASRTTVPTILAGIPTSRRTASFPARVAGS